MWRKLGAFQLGVIVGIIYGSVIATLTSYTILIAL